MIPIDDLLSRLQKVHRDGPGWAACCPAHEDKNPSLSIRHGADGRILLHCHTGCPFDAICSALNIEPKDLFPDSTAASHKTNGSSSPLGPVIDRYIYEKLNNGKPVPCLMVTRHAPKAFRQWHPAPNTPDGWALGQKARGPTERDAELVLFHWPQITEAIAMERTIFFVEGEKDVLNLEKAGLDATTTPGGAEKPWLPQYADPLQGARVVVIPDKDKPDPKKPEDKLGKGRRHALSVCSHLLDRASSVKYLELPGDTVKDASDFIEQGGTARQILELAANTPDFDPENPPEPPSQAAEGVISRHNVASLLTLDPSQDENEIIKHRFLCRLGFALLVGDSGIGKSSFLTQLAVYFSLGKPCAGLEPVRPLRVLLIQGENDDMDMAEFVQGVIRDGLNQGIFTEEELNARADCFRVLWVNSMSGDSFLNLTVRPECKDFKPDLLLVDPAFSYAGCDVSDNELVGKFLRQGFNKILSDFNAAGLINHHRPKPLRGKDKTSDSLAAQYEAHGAAEWTNAPRAILNFLRNSEDHTRARLHAAKRGTRLRWKDASSEKTLSHYLIHSPLEHCIAWRTDPNPPALQDDDEPTETPKPEKQPGRARPGPGLLLSLLPPDRSGLSLDPETNVLTSSQLLERYEDAGYSKNTFKESVDLAVEINEISEYQTPGRQWKKYYGSPNAIQAFIPWKIQQIANEKAISDRDMKAAQKKAKGKLQDPGDPQDDVLA